MGRQSPARQGWWERHRHPFHTPTPGPGSDRHRERSFRCCGRGFLWGGNLWGNKAALERTSLYFCVQQQPAQRDLRGSHSSIWRTQCPWIPGRESHDDERTRRFRDFPKRSWLASSEDHKLWVPDRQPFLSFFQAIRTPILPSGNILGAGGRITIGLVTLQPFESDHTGVGVRPSSSLKRETWVEASEMLPSGLNKGEEHTQRNAPCFGTFLP